MRREGGSEGRQGRRGGTEYNTNSNCRFMSLSQQASEVHHSQPSGGYGHGMHRTRSQGYVTSQSCAVYYPHSQSSPHGGERRGEPCSGPHEIII